MQRVQVSASVRTWDRLGVSLGDCDCDAAQRQIKERLDGARYYELKHQDLITSTRKRIQNLQISPSLQSLTLCRPEVAIALRSNRSPGGAWLLASFRPKSWEIGHEFLMKIA